MNVPAGLENSRALCDHFDRGTWKKKKINKIDHSAAPFIDADQSSGMTYSVILHKNVQKIRNSTRGRGVGLAGWGGREPRWAAGPRSSHRSRGERPHPETRAGKRSLPLTEELLAWKVHWAPAVKVLGGSIKLASQDVKRKLKVWTFK